jgi:vacuolar-type H+-ATPase subunit H
MSDIVERLRDDQPGERQCVREARMDLGGLLMEAADEIKKLRAALQSSRSDALEEAAQIAAHHERMAYQRGDLPLGDPNECAAQVAREIEAAIRTLGEKK